MNSTKSSNNYLPQSKVGILGGGQLARMLAIKGHELGLEIYVLSPSPEDSAAQVTPYWVRGNPNQVSALRKFLPLVDILTFESEFIDGLLLQKISRESKTPVQPRPLVMSQIQDRLFQKKGLKKWKLPQAPFYKVDNKEELHNIWRQLSPTGMVLKTRRFGYDGYGTFMVRSEKDFKCLNIHKDSLIAEPFQNFKRELAILAARNRQGEICFFPLVETKQKNARCFWVKGPTHHKKLPLLKKKITSYLTAYRYEGVIVFELFDMGGDILVNEVAPRVHNSAHYSLDALSIDQFTLHLLSILNCPLPRRPLQKTPGYAMLNLLGQTGKPPQLSLPPKIKLHWYGKKENRVGRKMGHINATSSTSHQALNILLQSHKNFRL